MAASVAVHGQAVVEVERAGNDTVAARIVQDPPGRRPEADDPPAQRREVSPTGSCCRRSPPRASRGRAVGHGRSSDQHPHHRLRHRRPRRRAHRGPGRDGASRPRRRPGQGRAVPGAPRRGRHHRLRQDRHAHPRRARGDRDRHDRQLRAGLGDQLPFAAGAEGNQSHPIADALRRHAEADRRAALGARIRRARPTASASVSRPACAAGASTSATRA